MPFLAILLGIAGVAFAFSDEDESAADEPEIVDPIATARDGDKVTAPTPDTVSESLPADLSDNEPEIEPVIEPGEDND